MNKHIKEIKIGYLLEGKIFLPFFMYILDKV